ncbi:MAG TPA: hypothetical protein VNM45_17530 [Bacillus sp. (in: firmicutes)]|nr:hypothetical protein [Bacillus sp. (in: firmicutes)]
MNTLKSIYEDIKQSIEHGTQSVKEKVSSFLQDDKMTVEQVATLIQHHPSTIKTQQTLLGITYHFYHLHTGQTTFYLEAKGFYGEHILYITAFNEQHVLFTYRSYDPTLSLKQTVTLQNIL